MVLIMKSSLYLQAKMQPRNKPAILVTITTSCCFSVKMSKIVYTTKEQTAEYQMYHFPDDCDCGKCTMFTDTHTCTKGDIQWDKEECCFSCPTQPRCSKVNIKEAPVFGSVYAISAVAADGEAYKNGSRIVKYGYNATDFKHAADVQAWLNYENAGQDKYWNDYIMPYFASLPADSPPSWAGPATQGGDATTKRLCCRMFSTGADGDLCRAWRNYELEQVREGDISDALNYDNLCTSWSNKYPWLPECACMKRNDPTYGDPYYRSVATAFKQATPNDGCWYVPCMDSNIDRMLIQAREDVPDSTECNSACVQIVNVVDSNNVDTSGLNMTCEITQSDDDDNGDDNGGGDDGDDGGDDEDGDEDTIPDDDDGDTDDARLTDKQKKELAIGLGVGVGAIILLGVGIFVASRLVHSSSSASETSPQKKKKKTKSTKT